MYLYLKAFKNNLKIKFTTTKRYTVINVICRPTFSLQSCKCQLPISTYLSPYCLQSISNCYRVNNDTPGSGHWRNSRHRYLQWQSILKLDVSHWWVRAARSRSRMKTIIYVCNYPKVTWQVNRLRQDPSLFSFLLFHWWKRIKMIPTLRIVCNSFAGHDSTSLKHVLYSWVYNFHV